MPVLFLSLLTLCTLYEGPGAICQIWLLYVMVDPLQTFPLPWMGYCAKFGNSVSVDELSGRRIFGCLKVLVFAACVGT